MSAQTPAINGTNVAGRIAGGGSAVISGLGAPVAAGNGRTGLGPSVIRNGGFGWGSPVMNNGRSGWGSPIMNNGNAGWGSPIMKNGNAGWGSPVLGTFQPGVSRTAINRGPGVYFNGGPGVAAGPLVRPSGTSTGYPAPDVNSVWYRRYQQRGSSYYDGYGGYGGYGYGYPANYNPVWITSGDQYYFDGNGEFNVAPAGMFFDQRQVFGAVQAQEEAGEAAEAPEAAQQADAPQREQPAERKRMVAKLTPEKLHELMMEGTKLFVDGKYNESASRFLRVTLADRQNVDATLAYAISRFATGDYQISALAVRRGIRRIPEVVDSAFDVRSRYGNVDHFRDHLARLEAYLVDHRDDSDAWIVLGFVKHFSGEREHAAEIFRRLKELPRADAVLADIFLEAKPQPAASETQPAADSEETSAGEDAVPVLLPRSEVASRQTIQLISVDAAE